MTFRFVSNVDGTDFVEATRDLDPAETLFVVSSKTFTTLETMTNAAHARATGRSRALGDEAAVAQALRRRLDERRGGGERSGSTPRTCSASGTGSAAATRWTRRSASRRCSRSGPSASRELLAGFHAMDEHFRTAPFERNLPVLMGLLAVWYTRLLRRRRPSRCCRTTSTSKRFPGVPPAADDGVERQVTSRSTARAVDYETGADLLGRARHERPAQLLPADPPGHDGSIPCDFIGFCRPLNPLGRHHDLLIANVFAQTEALAFGKTAEEVAPRARPSGSSRTASSRATGRRTRSSPSELTPHDARRARRALRARGVHAGRDLGHQLVRPVGRRARQGARAADRRRSSRPTRSRSSTHDSLDERADPALPGAEARRVS